MTTPCFYNSLTRKKEAFAPLEGKKVRLYTCGPTVYDYAHIGNFRTYVFEDLLRRVLQYFGYDVEHVMNLTDVDDKTIRGATREKVSLLEYTERFKQAFFEDIKTLNILPAQHYPAATDYIPQMIEMIETLLEKGVAYRAADQSIYFAIKRFPSYGALSHLHLDELEAGASQRVHADEYDKEHASDFVLWKAYDKERDGEIFWESPFGKGRPGWHIECSTMAMQLLGETIDIHMGGVDNLFPHHENEIAQSECCSGKPFARVWMHAEHLVVDNQKMSKSLGNFYTLRDLMSKGYSAVQVRYLLISTHYKTKLNFTLQGLDGAKNALQRIQDFLTRLYAQKGENFDSVADEAIDRAKERFDEALASDLQISGALAALFDLVRDLNIRMDQGLMSVSNAEKAVEFFKKVNEVLAVFDMTREVKIPEEIHEALQKRQEARQAKNWKQADELRNWIEAQGYQIEDGPQGLCVKRKTGNG